MPGARVSLPVRPSVLCLSVTADHQLLSSALPQAEYLVPPDGDHASYLACIDALPARQTPEVFGLHANADIGYYAAATKAALRDLLALQPRVGGMARCGCTPDTQDGGHLIGSNPPEAAWDKP
jgi:hypothetical protein